MKLLGQRILGCRYLEHGLGSRAWVPRKHDLLVPWTPQVEDETGEMGRGLGPGVELMPRDMGCEGKGSGYSSLLKEQIWEGGTGGLVSWRGSLGVPATQMRHHGCSCKCRKGGGMGPLPPPAAHSAAAPPPALKGTFLSSLRKVSFSSSAAHFLMQAGILFTHPERWERWST